MYIRQLLTATALTGLLALFGAFLSLPALAGDNQPVESFYDMEQVTGSSEEEASLPSHIEETIEVN